MAEDCSGIEFVMSEIVAEAYPSGNSGEGMVEAFVKFDIALVPPLPRKGLVHRYEIVHNNFLLANKIGKRNNESN